MLWAVLAAAGFCLPTAIAFTRHHRRRYEICVLNFTVTWIGALVWSLTP